MNKSKTVKLVILSFCIINVVLHLNTTSIFSQVSLEQSSIQDGPYVFWTENGAVVPVTITASMAGVESIALLAAKNASPLTSSYMLGKGAEGYVSTRVKMGKTSDVIAVVKAGGKVYTNKKEVKVTIGGCGG